MSLAARRLFPREPRGLLVTARSAQVLLDHGYCESQRLSTHGQRAGGERPGEPRKHPQGFFPWTPELLLGPGRCKMIGVRSLVLGCLNLQPLGASVERDLDTRPVSGSLGCGPWLLSFHSH